ncbi:GNAT family N-acetyltransferase [Thermosulfurimonas sp. F29]|uniref:GNAT family N-acetyltransferase n=1 Tax=Thermosulfurimonas sp. F29 TaxID=2867247 RepID=UPI001C83C27F|nr:GNAT family N-acetyltransferase [Thermosulfurimonas sp. F29]MBX6423458.1 GNAT family N-acetyltransferase [Thermosulfurimonas sp. F29]
MISPHLFVQPKWLDLYKEAYFFSYLVKDEMVLPLVFKNRFGLRVITHPPLTPYLGLPKECATREALDFYAKSIKDKRPDYVYIAFPPGVHDLLPFKFAGFTVEVRYTYILDLEFDEEKLWRNMDKTRRNDIRKAYNDRLQVVSLDIQSVSIAAGLIRKTFARQGRSVPWLGLARRIMEKSLGEGWGRGWLVKQGDTPISFTFIVWDETTAYYLLGGYDQEKRHHGAGPLGMWEAIRFAKSIGLKRFDFEGSEIPSIERYFRKFGGVLTPYYAVRYMSPRFQIFHALYRMMKRI